MDRTLEDTPIEDLEKDLDRTLEDTPSRISYHVRKEGDQESHGSIRGRASLGRRRHWDVRLYGGATERGHGRRPIGVSKFLPTSPSWTHIMSLTLLGDLCCGCLLFSEFGTRLFNLGTVRVLAAFDILHSSLISFLKTGSKIMVFPTPNPLISTRLAHLLYNLALIML